MKENYLIKEIKKMTGNLLAIGNFSEKILSTIEENKKITICNILSDTNITGSTDSKGQKAKKFNVSKLRKFKHNKIDYLLVDYENINYYINTFIKDSIYITNSFIYFYTTNKDKIIRRYKHYNVHIKEEKLENGYLLIIDVKNAKNNIFKEIIWKILDTIIDAIDHISETLLKG